MRQTFETEVMGFLTKAEFSKLRDVLKTKFGHEEQVKRLSIQMTDYANKNLDTRIRISNGEPEITQKIGSWNAQTREEVTVMLPTVPEIIFKHWQILNNLLVQDSAQKNIIQMKNYLYSTSDYEIKLTQQIGKEDAYSFEVESKRKGIDPVVVCQQFALKPDLKPKNSEYWANFNSRVNLDIRTMHENEVFDIIASYCLI